MSGNRVANLDLRFKSDWNLAYFLICVCNKKVSQSVFKVLQAKSPHQNLGVVDGLKDLHDEMLRKAAVETLSAGHLDRRRRVVADLE